MNSFNFFIIKLVGISIASGIRKAGKDFVFSSHHQALIYQGKEHPIEQFNAIVPDVMEKYKTYTARLPVVELLTRVVEEPSLEPVTGEIPEYPPVGKEEGKEPEGGAENKEEAPEGTPEPPVEENEEIIGLPPTPAEENEQGGEPAPEAPAEEEAPAAPARKRASRAKPKPEAPAEG